MPVTTVDRTEYTLLGDITEITKVQCQRRAGDARARPIDNEQGVELVVAGSLPAVSVVGEQLVSGETMLEAQVAELGASGNLYAKAAAWCLDADVLVLP